MKNLKGAVSLTALTVIAVFAIAGFALYMNPGLLSTGTKQLDTSKGGSAGSGGGSGYATNIRLGAFNAITSATANTNCELLDTNKQAIVVSTNVNGPTSMTSTGASTFSGYAICGNDDFAAAWRSWTDRGTEYYLSMFPISFSGRAGDVPYTNLKVYPESTPTWTGLDTGSVEATTNITVGSGQTIDTTEILLQTNGAQTALGNPDFNGDNPLALCINTTLSGLGEWNSVRPLNYNGIVPIPGVLGNRSVINGGCYQLSTNALVDDGKSSTTYKFGLRMQAKAGQNPGTDQGATPDHVTLFLMDKCWVINDQNTWTANYGYETTVGVPQDCGIDSITNGNIKPIYAN